MGAGSAQASSVEALRVVVEGWCAPVDGEELVEALGLVDRLVARLHATVGDLDVAKVWEHDGASSMTGWLRDHAGMTRRDAASVARTARRLRRWPATAQAWEEGGLSGGQVQAISANVRPEAAELYATGEADLVPALLPLSTAETAMAMRAWATRADAVLELAGPDSGPHRNLHLSRTLDGRHRLDGDLDTEGGEAVTRALRLATAPRATDGPHRTPAQARADALVDICEAFLAGQPRRGRQRPNINVLIDVEHLGTGTGARLDDGTPLDPTTTRRLLCDAELHRVITVGRSCILDYGTTTRTVSPALHDALAIRDGGCRWPGCDRPPHWCEGHHIKPWPQGPTRLDNLVLLCSRHHHTTHAQHGHRPGWALTLNPDGTLRVTSPEGTTRTTRPPPRPPPASALATG